MSMPTICRMLLEGLASTTLIFVLTLLFSLPLGLFVCFGRMSKWAPLSFLGGKERSRLRNALAGFKPIQVIVRFLISILRGTPLMLQLIVVCYGPYYLFNVKLSAEWTFSALIIGFVINYAAYFAEIYRSGIEAIPVGQYEAAEVLGYSRAQTFIKIILPQVIKNILPAVTNEVITLVKDTSLAFVLAYAEMFTIAKRIAASMSSVMPLFVAGLFYYIFNAVVAWAMEKCEKKLSYYR